jgi:prepilin-type N-terminal cleavage/methylation domain-containing protein
MRRRGFTLIEFLVVIAIIAILAAILFPVFARTPAKARQTSCLSNQKQLSLALLMYADDWDETLPLLRGVARGLHTGGVLRYGGRIARWRRGVAESQVPRHPRTARVEDVNGLALHDGRRVR